eukprot:CAMPEP_0113454614 /NCGR_PEP_ID=MMETSP0014_2-20120614/7952_1 /TAXON_ID=2857 /ORGANISM="Nitzschia sp." /LENGTH=339 /DNA_ID=CAMNT_0000346021 /DNA_START=31 /DNA_END=1050 /DNA_ORIENTATION=+ /assembly_acc=CAM_ASM_000159
MESRQADSNNNNNNNKTKFVILSTTAFVVSLLYMGLVDRFKKGGGGGGGDAGLSDGGGPSSSSFWLFDLLWSFIDTSGYDESYQEEIESQIVFVTTFLVSLLALRIVFSQMTPKLSGERTLNLHRLNEACMYKEVMLAYLNAAILEPVLSMMEIQDMTDLHLYINLAELASLCWWIWLISDAFNFEDVMQVYKFHYEFREDYESEKKKKFSFIKLEDTNKSAKSERESFMGSLVRDVALWGMIGSIAAAWLPGGITHRDVLHSYVVVVLWAILHHSARSATSWGINYFYTFLFPSAALMPLEYCLPLMDTADVVEDLYFVADYRQFVIDRTGVELMIEI